MTIDSMAEQKLGKAFPSSAPEAPQTLKDKYEALDTSVREKAKSVSAHCESLSTALAEFLPVLHEMQSLLSQRGADRETHSTAGLPTWSKWLDGFLKDTGLSVTAKTVRNHLARFRGTDKNKLKRPSRPLKLSNKNQRRLLTAVQCGNELVAALDNGGEYHAPLQEFRRIAMGSDSIERLLESIPQDTDITAHSLQLPMPVATPSIQVPTTPTLPQEPIPSPRRLPLPKSGNWSGLCDYVGDSCGEGIKEAFAGLEPVSIAENLGKFSQKLVDKYCRYDREAGDIRVTVEYVSHILARRAA